MRTAVVGGSGFVGTAVMSAFSDRGVEVDSLRAPRLTTRARSIERLREETHAKETGRLASALAGYDVVVIAAGVADAAASDDDGLFGANALLPLLVSRAVGPGVRVVLVSSAAVQGRASVLTESVETWPFSPYSRSKALGEEAVLEGADGIVFRPTSVHGPGRRVTASLVRLLASPLSSVAGRGDRPTPQVLVGNVADAIAFTALSIEVETRVVLQPSEGLTTASLAKVLGARSPFRVPTVVACTLVSSLRALGKLSGALAAVGRRLEMLWFGQRQQPGWLNRAGWQPVVGRDGWAELARSHGVVMR